MKRQEGERTEGEGAPGNKQPDSTATLRWALATAPGLNTLHFTGNGIFSDRTEGENNPKSSRPTVLLATCSAPPRGQRDHRDPPVAKPVPCSSPRKEMASGPVPLLAPQRFLSRLLSHPASAFYAETISLSYQTQPTFQQGGTGRGALQYAQTLLASLGSCPPLSRRSSFSGVTDRSHVHLGENDKTRS